MDCYLKLLHEAAWLTFKFKFHTRYNLTEAVGSWAYMAPEVVLGQPYNEKVDVFR